MKKIKIISCILCLVICICCGCSNEVDQKSTSSQSNTISNNEKNKTITVHKDKNTIKGMTCQRDMKELVQKKIVLGNF